MNKLIVPTFSAVIGGVLGAVLAPAVAQRTPPPTPRWEHACDARELRGGSALTEMMRDRGASGWEAFGFSVQSTTGGGPQLEYAYVCYRRPVR